MLLEPVTSITDLMLAGMAAGFAGGAYLRFRRTRTGREALWAGSFGALGLATLLGALVHGFSLGVLREPVWLAVWSSVAVSQFLFVLAALSAACGAAWAERLTLPIAVVFLLLFGMARLVFGGMIIYEAVALAVGTLLYLWVYLSMGQARLLAFPLAMIILAAGGVLHLSGAAFTAVWQFNHNDIFHLAMMAALPWFYLGADPALLTPKSGQRRGKPGGFVVAPRLHVIQGGRSQIMTIPAYRQGRRRQALERLPGGGGPKDEV